MKKGLTEKEAKIITPELLNSVVLDFRNNYTWDHTLEFGLNGKEFEIMFNTLLNFVSNPLGLDSINRVAQMYSMLETKFKVGILTNKIKVKPFEDKKVEAIEEPSNKNIEQLATEEQPVLQEETN